MMMVCTGECWIGVSWALECHKYLCIVSLELACINQLSHVCLCNTIVSLHCSFDCTRSTLFRNTISNPSLAKQGSREQFNE